MILRLGLTEPVGRVVDETTPPMAPREQLRSVILRALQHPKVTALVSDPRFARAAMRVVSLQARMDRLGETVTRAAARAFNLPTREDELALRRRIQRLETRLRALEEDPS